MIDVLVEASSPDLYAEIAELLRDHSQLRLIESAGDADKGESEPRADVVLVALDAQRENAVDSFGWNAGGPNLAGWHAAGVPVILLVENPSRSISEPLPAGVRGILPRNVTPAEIVGAIEAVAAGLY